MANRQFNNQNNNYQPYNQPPQQPPQGGYYQQPDYNQSRQPNQNYNNQQGYYQQPSQPQQNQQQQQNDNISMYSYSNAKKLVKSSKKAKRRGWIYMIIGGWFALSMAFGMITSITVKLDLGIKAGMFIFYLVLTFLFCKLFIHGRQLVKNAPKQMQSAKEQAQNIYSQQLPYINYGNGQTLHTHFVIEIPFLTEVKINNNILKIKTNKISQRNQETIINLNDVSNIKFKDFSISPGYLGFETPAHPIPPDDFKTDPNTIPFADVNTKPYVLELKAYTEWIMSMRQYNQQNYNNYQY